MKRKTTTIVLITTFIVILACSIIFGTIVTCMNRQKPLIVLEMSLDAAVQQGLAENYDYFIKTDLGTHKYDGTRPRFNGESIIFMVDDSLGDNYKVNFWYCKYLLRSQKEGMCEIDNISIMDFESYLNREYWGSIYEINDKINLYYIHTFANYDNKYDLMFDSCFVITASQKTINDMAYKW